MAENGIMQPIGFLCESICDTLRVLRGEHFYTFGFSFYVVRTK